MNPSSAFWLNGKEITKRLQSFNADRFTPLMLDPISLRPWDIARLTDWQIDALYYGPAVKRKEEMDEEIEAAKSGRPARGPSDANLGSLPKAKFVEEMMARTGGSPEKWGEAWEEMRAAKPKG